MRAIIAHNISSSSSPGPSAARDESASAESPLPPGEDGRAGSVYGRRARREDVLLGGSCRCAVDRAGMATAARQIVRLTSAGDNDNMGWTEISNVPLVKVLGDKEPSGAYQRRTNIVCALGPASRSVDILVELLAAGMNVARLNFSHGDHEYHLCTLNNLRRAIDIRRRQGHDCYCAVLMDTKGPEIRTGFLRNHSPVHLVAGQTLEISTNYSILGDERLISCSYKDLPSSVSLGGRILIADGSITCTITAIREHSVFVRVENSAALEERKNMNLPGVHLRLPGITEKDRYDIEHFALVHNVDIVSGSFIRSAANVRALRKCLRGASIRVHAKIESVEALQNIDEIIGAADGIHVSRGDLGMELSLSKLFLAQKFVIHKANIAGKPVVTSTQMLESMTVHPRPTNAECNDVANAVLDGSDCLMLSGETAKGLYPREAVLTMARIINEAEKAIDYDAQFQSMRKEGLLLRGRFSMMESLASSAVESAMDIDAPLIIVFSFTGKLALLVAKYRPVARILVVTGNEKTANQVSVSRGACAIWLPVDILLNVKALMRHLKQYVIERKWFAEERVLGFKGREHRVVRVGSVLDEDPKVKEHLEDKMPGHFRLTHYVDVVTMGL